MPKGFYFLIAAQFASGLADNALLILGIYFLKEQGYPGWLAPLLKFSLTLAYVLLASLVGPIADAFPKGKLMAYMSVIKILGVFFLLIGVQPLCAFALVGLAASVFAPAKYGLVTESVPSRLLVRANAWLEVSMVLSVVLGVAVGGALIGLSEITNVSNLLIQTQTLPAMGIVILLYLIGAFFNFRLQSMNESALLIPLKLHALQWSTFWKSNQKLWRDPLGSVSLYVTTLYWGVGAVMQFAVLTWAQNSLGLSLRFGAYLQALVAIGVIAGAYMAARLFKLHLARQALPWGLLLAVLLPLMVTVTQLWLAVPLLLCIGVAGGMLLVPMNALLQRRGMQVLSSGRSIAVQGFNENLCVLIMLAGYSALLAFGIPLTIIMLLLAMILIAGIAPMCKLVLR